VENLRELSADRLDAKNIAEELQDLGKTERRALASHTRNLLLHLLKYEFQRKERSASWKVSIDNARAEIEDILTQSPSLRHDFAAQIKSQYSRARRRASIETSPPAARFPESCPYSPEQLLDDEYLPAEG
jgi:predicted  nucleic acid-binding Zn-ribbon protein